MPRNSVDVDEISDACHNSSVPELLTAMMPLTKVISSAFAASKLPTVPMLGAVVESVLVAFPPMHTAAPT